MATIESMFAPLVRPATWGLVHFLWQGVLVALLLASALALLGRLGAVFRYRAACTALAVMVALPVITAAKYRNPAAAFYSVTVESGGYVVVTSYSPSRSTPGFVLNSGYGTESKGWERSVGSVLSAIERSRGRIFVAWLAGVLILTVLHTMGWARVRRIRRRGGESPPAGWLETATRLCRQMGVNRAVGFVKSAAVEVPTVIGWLSPVVLIPAAAFTGLSAEQLRCLLAHEIAHVKRNDYLVNVLQVIAETLLFFHPAVWWVSKQIRIERENCCDDIAVGASDSRIVYAHALMRLEEIRYHQTGFAMRADGGSLLARIRRLAGGNNMSNTQNRPWLAGVALAALLVIGGAALSSAVDRGNRVTVDSRGGEYATMQSEFEIEGKWDLERLDGTLLMEVRVKEGRNRMNTTFEFDENDFTGLDYGADDQFELHRDAGSFYFAGDFKKSGRRTEGRGRFGFVPDYEYADKIGLRRAKDHELLLLAAKDVGEKYIREMRDLGYDDLDGDELVSMAIHGVSVEYVREMKKAGYEAGAGELVRWRIHGVSPEFAREMAEAGFDTDSADQLIKYRIHGVDPEFVHEIRELGIDHIDDDDLVRMKIHGVSPHFVRGMHDAGYESLDVDELVAWRIHGVNPEYVAAMKEVGVTGIRTRDLKKMRIHGVSPSFVRDLNELGYTDIDVDDLVRMKIHGVTPSYIRRIQKKTTEDPSIDMLIKLKIHGIRL